MVHCPLRFIEQSNTKQTESYSFATLGVIEWACGNGVSTMTDDKVIHIYDWRPAFKPGELGCALVELSTPTQPERARKMRPSEVAMVIVSIALVSLLIAGYV